MGFTYKKIQEHIYYAIILVALAKDVNIQLIKIFLYIQMVQIDV